MPCRRPVPRAIDPDWPGRRWARAPDGSLARVEARCSGGPSTLCLWRSRFRVELEWAQADSDGVRAESMGDDAGTFFLGKPSNTLLAIQIRDARKANGHYWVHVDSKTTRGFSLIVTDMGRSTTMRYHHPEGQITKFTDHEAF